MTQYLFDTRASGKTEAILKLPKGRVLQSIRWRGANVSLLRAVLGNVDLLGQAQVTADGKPAPVLGVRSPHAVRATVEKDGILLQLVFDQHTSGYVNAS